MKNYKDHYAILDLNACILHSYHGATDEEPLTGKDGDNITTAEAGFNAFLDLYLVPILESFQPRQILATVDRGHDYQTSLYPEYKKGRKEKKATTDPIQTGEITKLKEAVKRLLLQIGATVAGVEGAEADDLIAYLVNSLPGYKQLYSVDSDFVQLLSQPDVQVDLFLKGELLDQVYGSHKTCDADAPVKYRQWRLFRSLIGKSTDGYLGIRGFGTKSWASLTEALSDEQMEELDRVILTRDWIKLQDLPIPEKLFDKLNDSRTEWIVAYALAGLHPELCWKPRNRKIPKISWLKRVGNQATLQKIMRLMKASDRVEEFQDYIPTEWLVDANNFEESDISEFSEMLKKTPHLSFDYESWSDQQGNENFNKAYAWSGDFVDVLSQKITGVSFNFGANLQYTMYVTVDHADTDNLPMNTIKRFLEAVPASTVVVAQNSQFEVTLTKTNLDMDIDEVHDTSIMQVYVDESQEAHLKGMSKRLLNYDQVDYQTVTGGKRMNELSAKHVLSYGCDDSLVTGRIYDLHKLQMLLEGTWEFLAENESCVANVLSHSYIHGNKIDWELLAEIHKQDIDTYDENYHKLHKLMKENATKISPKAARAFFEADEPFRKSSLRNKFRKGDPEAPISFADHWHQYKEKELLRLSTASVYHPYTKELQMKEFSPTKGNLFKLIERLGFNDKPTAYSARRIEEWCNEHLSINWEVSSEAKDSTQEFVQGLLAAAKNIVKAADRNGTTYDHFMKICNKVVDQEDNTKIIVSGDELSIGSPKQSQEMLYLKMGLPVRMRSKVQPGSASARAVAGVDGSPATSELAVNWALAEDMSGPDDWRIEALEAYKKAKTAKTDISLFCVPYPLWKHPYDGRIHPSIRNCGAKATKRFSGSSPNVQQVSGKGDLREIFLAEDGEVVIGIDVSGQELRMTAAVSKDANMLSAYVGAPEDLKDLHSITGAGIAHMGYEEFYAAYLDESHPDHEKVAAVRKRKAKPTNFLLSYGGTAIALAQRLIIPLAEAEEILERTFDTYPGLRKWQKDSAKHGRDFGFTKTLFGNRRHATANLWSSDSGAKSRMERQLANAEIQGSAADQIKRLLTLIWKTGVIKDLGVSWLISVHDEIVASVPKQSAVEYVRRISALMKMPIPNCIVPFEVDVAIGPSWGETRELGSNPTAEEINNAVWGESV